MKSLKTAKVFQSGNSLVIKPKMDSWDDFLSGFTGLSADFSVEDDLPNDVPRICLYCDS